MNEEWRPRGELTAHEVAVLKLCKKQKLWGFLREFREVILDAEIRSALAAMYPPDGPGRPPFAPERLALAMLLQVGFGVADHEVPTLTAVDARWQMVLDLPGQTTPAFSQGTVFNFRERARANGLMRRLLDKTVKIARETKGFSDKRLRAIIDSSPLVGAGRVEDTFNLLGRAIAELLDVAAAESERDAVALADELEITVAFGSSVKAVLDVDWREPSARAEALRELLAQFDRVRAWLHTQFDRTELSRPPLSEHLATVERIIAQDTDPDPDPASEARAEDRDTIREGVAKDRLVSLSDRDMRHGRKSRSRVFNGYKRHVAADADVPGLVADVFVLPANRPEHEAAAPIVTRLETTFDIVQMQIDRGYLPSETVRRLRRDGVDVVSKPPALRVTAGLFTKDDFVLNPAGNNLTCPAGAVAPVPPSRQVAFPVKTCQACDLREKCLPSTTRRGRFIRLHPQEAWHREMSADLATRAGRAKRRERVIVEHVLARVSGIQSNRSRYRGLAKNQHHTEAAAVVNNCYVLGGLFAEREAA